MKKHKSFFRGIIVFTIIQSIIFLLFCKVFNESKPIDLEKTARITVLVEEKTYERGFNEYRFGVVSNSEKYLFSSLGLLSKYSNNELYKTIKEGDVLSILYYEEKTIFGNRNWVIEASSQTEQYRSLDEYYASKKGLVPLVVCVLFIPIELIVLSVGAVYFWFYKPTKKRKVRSKMRPMV